MKGGRRRAVDSALDALEKELRCCICLEALFSNEPPRNALMLPCAHRYCSECLVQVESNGLQCSVCRRNFIKREIIPDHMTENLVLRTQELRKAVVALWEEPEEASGDDESPVRAKRRRRGREEDQEDEQHRLALQQHARLEALRQENAAPLVKKAQVMERSRCKSPVIVATGLENDNLRTLRTAVRKCGGRVVNEWQNGVTHVVCTVDQDGRSRRTLKYMCGVVAGCAVVTWQWVEMSLQRGWWLDETSFLVFGDSISDGGPARAFGAGPLWKGRNLRLQIKDCERQAEVKVTRETQ